MRRRPQRRDYKVQVAVDSTGGVGRVIIGDAGVYPSYVRAWTHTGNWNLLLECRRRRNAENMNAS